MISAVDTNILLDLLSPTSPSGDPAQALLENAFRRGALVLCEIVYAEVATRFPSRDLLHRFLAGIQIRLVHSSEEALFQGGHLFREYLKRKPAGEPRRDRILSDFLIAGHAAVHADVLLTKDRGFYRTYFKDLRIEEPS